MKFGKRIEREAWAPYRHYYLDYASLKKAVKCIHERQKQADEINNFDIVKSTPVVDFQLLLEQQLWRVNSFAELRLQILTDRLAQIAKDVNDRLQPGKNNNVKSFIDVRQVEADLNVCAEQLIILDHYARINYEGFRKITKKYDKGCGEKQFAQIWLMQNVMRQPFMQMPLLAASMSISLVHFMLRQVDRKTAFEDGRLSVPPAMKSNKSNYVWTRRKYFLHPQERMAFLTAIGQHLKVVRQDGFVGESNDKDFKNFVASLQKSQNFRKATSGLTMSCSSVYFDDDNFNEFKRCVTSLTKEAPRKLSFSDNLMKSNVDLNDFRVRWAVDQKGAAKDQLEAGEFLVMVESDDSAPSFSAKGNYFGNDDHFSCSGSDWMTLESSSSKSVTAVNGTSDVLTVAHENVDHVVNNSTKFADKVLKFVRKKNTRPVAQLYSNCLTFVDDNEATIRIALQTEFCARPLSSNVSVGDLLMHPAAPGNISNETFGVETLVEVSVLDNKNYNSVPPWLLRALEFCRPATPFSSRVYATSLAYGDSLPSDLKKMVPKWLHYDIDNELDDAARPANPLNLNSARATSPKLLGLSQTVAPLLGENDEKMRAEASISVVGDADVIVVNAEQGSAPPPENADVVIEPKMFYANERTFLSWLNLATTVNTLALAFIHIDFSESPIHSSKTPIRGFGLTLFLVAVLILWWSIWVYWQRSRALHNRQFSDTSMAQRFAPFVVSALLLLSLGQASFSGQGANFPSWHLFEGVRERLIFVIIICRLVAIVMSFRFSIVWSVNQFAQKRVVTFTRSQAII